MSEENQAPEVPSIPQEVLDLQKTVGELSTYRTAFGVATFPGSQVEAATNLRNFLNETYQQVLKQFNEHPYVVKVRADAAKREEEAKLAALGRKM